MPTYDDVDKLEKTIAEFFGAPYALATDCCTHAIELCFRISNVKHTSCPTHTYLSIPMTLKKLGITFNWIDAPWVGYYGFDSTNILDAATLWQKDSYIPNTLMCLSFQFKKHLSLGRGGMILCDNLEQRELLEMLAHDGRKRNVNWHDQIITQMGYHYYMTPETAEVGLTKFNQVKDIPATVWDNTYYPDLRKMPVFAT